MRLHVCYRRGCGRKQRRLDGETEAYLVAYACSEPPLGQGRWTLGLLADKMVELNHVESLSTVNDQLKNISQIEHSRHRSGKELHG